MVWENAHSGIAALWRVYHRLAQGDKRKQKVSAGFAEPPLEGCIYKAKRWLHSVSHLFAFYRVLQCAVKISAQQISISRQIELAVYSFCHHIKVFGCIRKLAAANHNRSPIDKRANDKGFSLADVVRHIRFGAVF